MKKFILAGILAVLLLGLCSCALSDPCSAGHTPTSYTDTSPTCTEEGKTVVFCTVCGKELYTESIPKLEHSPVSSVKNPATCAAEGELVVKCTVCDKELSSEPIPKTEHDSLYTQTTNATCLLDGEIVTKCSHCEQVISTKNLPKLGHTAGTNWEITAPHGCTTEGTRVKKCVNCHEILETQSIPASHTPVVLKAVSPTCSAEGCTEGSKCSVCSEILIKQQPIEKTAHNFVNVDAVAPTCSEYGYTKGQRCSLCSAWAVEPKKIDKTPHSLVTDPGKSATCTENGLTAGKHCKLCQKVTVPQETIQKRGHQYSVYNNTCSGCGDKQYREIASRLDLDNNSDGDVVIYLDKCVTVSNTNEYWTYTIKSTTNYVRLVGTLGQTYLFNIVVESRKNDLTIDLVDASLKSITNEPVIKSTSSADITLGFYGLDCSITGKTGADGRKASYLKLTYNGEKGGDGFDAISIGGDLLIKAGTSSIQIKGGNGGNGGAGMDAAPAPNDGGNGGNGGNGAYAIKASSITITGVDGCSSQSVRLAGGNGGSGGSAGKGFLWGKNGKTGSTGKTEAATTVTPTYN